MDLATLLTATASAIGQRTAIGPRAGGLTYAQLLLGAQRAGAIFGTYGARTIALVDVNSPAVPLALYGAAYAGRPFAPLNYRLSDERLRSMLDQIGPALVIAGEPDRIREIGADDITVVSRTEILEVAAGSSSPAAEDPLSNPDDVAIRLFTSGTTGAPKAAVLRHRNLASYVTSTVEFLSAEDGDCALVSVPPYHIAGISAILTSGYAGRRLVYLESFDAAAWLEVARREHVTHAMVVPTMLARILDELTDGCGLPSMRTLAYGGGPMPLDVIERALRLLPGVDFVNAYGLTETSSTVTVLGPEEHRAALASDDPAIRMRLRSVGRPLPSVHVSIRDQAGQPVATGERGEIWVRGEQVSGEYADGIADRADWFLTRDSGHFDSAGYLFVHGRLDDVIVRGGENLAPLEIELALESHPAVAAAAVVGMPDREWGEQVVAVVVLRHPAAVTEAELKDHVRARLRSIMTPAEIHFRERLPYNETGKLLRRIVREDLLRQ